MKKILAALAAAATMVTAMAIPASAADLGDLTVDGFFTATTDKSAVELKSGDTATITFDNKSNGTNNWDNFIVAVVGANHTSADEEVVIIRADAWGWGGGLSDLAAPDGTGNTLAFNSDINWDEWVAAMQAGVKCDVTISRDNDTLTYTAKIGDYNVSSTIISGVALPESCYIFLTGENCALTGIKAEVTSAAAPAEPATLEATEADGPAVETTAPSTGNVAVASVAAVMSLAGIAMIVSRKRK